MKIKPLVVLFTTIFSVTSHAEEAWFQETPLQQSYRALLADNPSLAWQEMLLALGSHEMESSHGIHDTHWLPLKNEIIEQTQCGRTLLTQSNLSQNVHVRLTLQKKTNLLQQGYQFKLSLDGIKKKVKITLVDSKEHLFLSGVSSPPKEAYSELEGDEMLSPPPSGYYLLSINEVSYPLILSPYPTHSWLALDEKGKTRRLTLSPPPQRTHCPLTTLRWQWLDAHYDMLGDSKPMLINNTYIEKNKDQEGNKSQRISTMAIPLHNAQNAKWISAVISQSEYQNHIRIEYAQRLTLPVPTQK